VHFAFDEEQLAFRSHLRAFAEKECSPAQLREAWASELGWSPTRWRGLAEMGVVGLTVPAEHGGVGLGFVDLVLLLEEAGRSGLPEPVLETTALAVPALVEAEGPNADAVRVRWLDGVAAGDAVVTVGLQDAPGVTAAAGAHLLLLEHDGSLHALEGADVAVTARPSIDGAHRLARVTWNPTPDTVLVSGAPARAALSSLRRRAAVGTAALLVGIAERLVTMASDYAKERHQFGKPIGSFQAVKHHLADAAVRVEFARPVVYRAAWSLAEGEPDDALHASMAKASASDAATLAARAALQVHGAIGYTWEHDLHLWMKRAWSLSAAWGDAGWHRSRLLGDVDW
jgi:alkylation response protein AidB-like acyl-CoA dehydrogenase